jgi:hypothetical protein
VLFGYIDNDMDGVEDKDDLCPKSLMTDLVDLTGCSIKSLISPHHFAISSGLGIAEDEDASYTFSTFNVNYYYKKISVQLSSSYYDLESDTLNSSGTNDTYFNLFYTSKIRENFSLTLGTGTVLPSFDDINNSQDYTTSIFGKYAKDNWTLSAGASYAFIGDVNANNKLAYNMAIGYYWNTNFYSSLGYYVSESIYDDVEDFESLSLSTYYDINKNWFAILSLTEGMSAVSLDNSMGVKVGYYW